MILLISPGEDTMIDAVAAELDRRGCDWMRLSTTDFPRSMQLNLYCPLAQSWLSLGDRRLPVGDIEAVYHRVSYRHFAMDPDYDEHEREHVRRQCWQSFCAFLNHLDCLVVNPPMSARSNLSKPMQLEWLAQRGLKVPATLVTSCPERARAFYHAHQGQVIYKSISSVRSVVHKMTADDLERLDSVKNCPLQLQQYIAGEDVRVHVVGDLAAWAVKIRSKTHDYRYDPESELKPFQLPEDLEDLCIDLAEEMELPLAGVDLRRTPQGEWYAFEINPMPGYSYFELNAGVPITASLCDLLQG